MLIRFYCTKKPVSSSLYEVYCDETERNKYTGSGVLLAKCLKFIQVCDCWSDSMMRNKLSVIRSPKCSAIKPEAVKQPEVMCCFPNGSGVSLPYRKWCVAFLPEVMSFPYQKWCVASLSEVVSRFHTGSDVSLPYRKWCVVFIPEVCRFRSTCISNCGVLI